MNDLGVIYSNGLGGVQQSYERAAEYYEQAAHLDAKAQYGLGALYANGQMCCQYSRRS